MISCLINQGSEQDEQRQPEVHQEPIGLNQSSDLNTVGSEAELSVESAIQGKPKGYMKIVSELYASDYGCKYLSLLKQNFCYRLDQYVKQTSKPVEEKTASLDPGSRGNSEESGNFVDVSDIQVRFMDYPNYLCVIV